MRPPGWRIGRTTIGFRRSPGRVAFSDKWPRLHKLLLLQPTPELRPMHKDHKPEGNIVGWKRRMKRWARGLGSGVARSPSGGPPPFFFFATVPLRFLLQDPRPWTQPTDNRAMSVIVGWACSLRRDQSGQYRSFNSHENKQLLNHKYSNATQWHSDSLRRALLACRIRAGSVVF